MDNIAIVIEVVFLALVLLTATTLACALLTGPFLLWFLLFAALGIIMPLAMQGRVSMGGAHPSRGLLALASVLVLVGGLIMRFMIVMVAQT